MDSDFDANSATKLLRDADPTLGALIDRIGPYELGLKPTTSVFAALAEAIVYQQLHGKAAATIFGRVQALFPSGFTPRAVLSSDEETLRGAGLSRNKMLALQDLAAQVDTGALPELADLRTMPDEDVINALTPVRGIGRWTAEMFLMFRLGRPDVLPVDDFGVRKGFALTFAKGEMPKPRELAEYGTRWRPYRSVASWYLWRAADTALLAD